MGMQLEKSLTLEKGKIQETKNFKRKSFVSSYRLDEENKEEEYSYQSDTGEDGEDEEGGN